MEGKKEMGGSNSNSNSSPSFTSELFGSKDSGSSSSSSSSSSSGIFNSIFASSNKPFGRESVRSEVMDKKQEFGTKPAAPDTIPRDKEGESKSPPKRENSSYYQEQRVQPCHLSSSIYYGGQDVYNSPRATQSSGYPTFNKDGGEDDGCASRGNWWQGSLYY